MTSAVVLMSSSSTMPASNSLCLTGPTLSICPNCRTASPGLISVRRFIPERVWRVPWTIDHFRVKIHSWILAIDVFFHCSCKSV